MNDFDAAFANLRRGPWHNDPNQLPQELGIRNGQIDSQGYLSDNAVTSDVIRANAIIASKISANAIETNHLSANVITASKISAGAVETNHLAANAVVASKIAAGTITANEIATNTITSVQIAADAIRASEIEAGAVTADELAANSVITSKVLAGNITSGKIELTISAKNFGTNKGSLAAPGVFFDLDNTLGLTLNGTNTDVILGSGNGVGDPYFQVGPSAGGAMLGQAGDLFPGTDNSFSCGVSGGRWLDVWAVDTTINSSDERLKKDVEDSSLGLQFVKSLRPVSYRWRDTVDTQAREATKLDSDALAREVAPHVERIEQARADQLAGVLDDAGAERIVVDAREQLSTIKARHLEPVKAARMARRPGRRVHFGLLAGEVKQALDAAGVDAALFKIGSDGIQSLGYTELIAPALKAIQELAETNEHLSARVAALEDA